jgi:uncharacterized protein (DUF2062 family)/SAM-dependent methyltransferase
MPRPSSAHPPAQHGAAGFWLRRAFHGLRTEGSGAGHEAGAVGVGVFIGCLPFYGFHLLLCWVVGRLLGLNRLKVYLAANISNPFVAPFLVFAELQAGSWLRRGEFHPMTLDAVKAAGVMTLGVDLLLGSVVVGAALAALAAWGTYATLKGTAADAYFVDLVRRASDRYVSMSITAWEFARGKLRHDPVYRAAACDGLLTAPEPRGPRTLVDVGCGQGLMLALLAEARRAVQDGTWQGPSAPPVFDRMVGIETRPRVASIAAAALQGDAEIVAADARSAAMPRAHVVLLFDVLHLMPAGDQETLLRALAASLEEGGTLVVREADASAGWRFAAIRAGNALKALAIGRWRQTFHFRSGAEWLACFARLGLHADIQPMGQGTPFANVLFRVTPLAAGAGDAAPTSRRGPLV